MIWAAKSSGLYNERFWIPIHTRGCPTLGEAGEGGRDSGTITPCFVQYWITPTEAQCRPRSRRGPSSSPSSQTEKVARSGPPPRPVCKPGDAYRFLGLLDLVEQSETASPEFGDSNFLHDR